MLRSARIRRLEDAKQAALPKPSKRARISPLVYGAGMIGVGLLLKKVNPRFGDMPNPLQYGGTQKHSKRIKAATFARDRAANFSPSNLTTKLGKSLMIGGTAMLAARLLDEAVGRKL